MSKPQPKANAEGDGSSAQQIPGRTLGLSIMCLMIVFVAAWMTFQSRQQEATVLASAEALASVTGLRSDAWYLPDEPLLGFVKIPAGTFTMGSNPALDRLAYENERWSSSRRQGSVELADFYIGKFEVTAAHSFGPMHRRTRLWLTRFQQMQQAIFP